MPSYNRDQVLSDITLSNKYSKKYTDFQGTSLQAGNLVIYPKRNPKGSLGVAHIEYHDVTDSECTLVDVPCVKDVDGTLIINNGMCFYKL